MSNAVGIEFDSLTIGERRLFAAGLGRALGNKRVWGTP